nr:hypothetical protein BaRGS_011367 [Batillaria attramentaria]
MHPRPVNTGTQEFQGPLGALVTHAVMQGLDDIWAERTGKDQLEDIWKQLGKPKLDDVTHRYESASKHDLPVLGTFMGQTKDPVTDLFKEELGCLKDFELEVKFKSDAKPVFHKARPVPFALRDDLTKGYEEGIAKGVWKPVQFYDYGTPVVPIQELMQKLGGGFGYSKIDLANAYNQIKLAPESQRRLALSTHLQFYGKFIPNLATMAEPLYRLTKKANPWKWGEEEQAAFEQLKNVLSSDQVLIHFDPEKPVGLACDASNVGIGAVLLHRYPDGSERPIANVSKTLSAAERNYSQIHKEALAIIYGLRKFYQYLYGRQFIPVTDHKPLTALFGPKRGTPLLAANRLARWALWLNQFDYTIEYRKTADHGNADALSRLPSGDDIDFDREESGEDTDMVCAIRVLSLQVKPFDANILRQESGKDPVIATVMRYVREGWPLKHAEINEEVRKFQKLSDSLSICHGCLIYGTRVVIPQSLQPKILDLLHIGHFGMERMKQLARTAVYWPGIDAAIEMTSRRCDSCGEHQNKPSKPQVHPWMLPEKPWSGVHLDHAINFMGTNWLVITDAYSKYPCIHPTSSTSTRATLDLLEEDFAHFGYPHTLVSDNATTFVSEEFQSWCKERGITHLTGAPYHPATNGAAERLADSDKDRHFASLASTHSSGQAIQGGI